MGQFAYNIRTFDGLFVHQLRDIYYAENHILRALSRMINRATDPRLKDAFAAHAIETRGHIERLEEVFRLYGATIKGVDCPAIDGILLEGDEVISEVASKDLLDTALVAAAQAVEHYEITRYGTLIAWAKRLGRHDCAELLTRNLEQEKAADLKLTHIAEQAVNLQAAE